MISLASRLKSGLILSVLWAFSQVAIAAKMDLREGVTEMSSTIQGLHHISLAICVVMGIIVFGALAIQSVRFVPYMAATWETGEDLMLPLWPFMGFMCVCSLVFVARLLSNPEGEPAEGEAQSDWI